MSLPTDLTKLLGIRHPVMLAGMGNVARAELVAAVTNAGGLGTIGGVFMTPKLLREQIKEVKTLITDKQNPKFGVDLLLPQIGGGARKTNSDYTKGELPELIDVIIEEGTSLFVSAVGIPPRWVVEKLHKAGIPVMNMCGHPRHAEKALSVSCDIICCQGSEGGGHTGDIGTSVLVPECVDIVRGKKSELTGGPIYVVAAGGIFDGRGLAAALSWGAQAVWVGTRFVATPEASAGRLHKNSLLKAQSSDTRRSLVFTGRPMRVIENEYVIDWDENREAEQKKLLAQGKLPYTVDLEKAEKEGKTISIAKTYPMLSGQATGPLKEILPAGVIVESMVKEAVEVIKATNRLVSRL